MLFDLRGSGRRRVVKIVYVTLALLMGGGLVLFGIGGGGALSGGLLDAITESNNSGGSSSDRYVRAEAAATAKARANPQDAALWAAVARARFNLASASYDQNTGQYSAEGQQELRNAARAWQEHVKLARQPDERVASPHGPGVHLAQRRRRGRRRAGGRRRVAQLRRHLRPSSPSWPTPRARPARAISRATRRSS